MNYKKTAFVLIISALAIIAVGCSNSEINNFGPLGSAHKHADIKIYVLGNAIDLSQQKYQLKSDLVHFEDFDGDVVHTHAAGMTLGYTLKTLGMNINENCLKLDTGKEHCSAENGSLKVYVKGHDLEWEKMPSHENYIIQNLDMLLVAYGPESEQEIKKQMESVTQKAQEYAEEQGHED